MRFAADRAVLYAAIHRVRRLVPAGNVINPILAHVKFVVGRDRVTLACADDHSLLEVSFAARAKRAGETTASAPLLDAMLRLLPEGSEALVEAEESGAALSLRCGRFTARLCTLPAADFPDHAPVDPVFEGELAAAEFARIIGRTRPACASPEKRLALSGCRLHPFEQRLRAVATDGERLCADDMALPAPDFPAVTVPAELAGEIAALCDGTGGETLTLKISKTRIEAARGDARLIGPLLDADFPDYLRNIPQHNNTRINIARAEFAGALDRLLTVAAQHAVRAALAGSRLALSAHGANKLNQRGGGIEELTVGGGGEEAGLIFGFDGATMLRILTSLQNDGVILALGKPEDAILISPMDDSGAFDLLAPMRPGDAPEAAAA